MGDTLEKVSVIMPAYNCEKYIAKTIASVVAQTYTDWELLVCDDCSTDSTKAIVEAAALADARIKCLTTPTNLGASEARNYGIERATGRYIAFLDSDDLWYPDKLEKQIAFMNEKKCVLSCTAYEHVNENGEKTGRVVVPPKKAGYNYCLFVGNCIGNSTAVYDTLRHGKVYVPTIRKRNDFALWLRILKKGEIVCGMPEILTSYSNRSDSLSSKHKFGLIRYHWQLYRDIEQLSIIKSCFAVVTLLVCKTVKLLFNK